MRKYLFDYHTQTLEHGKGKVPQIAETIEAAIARGLSAICLTDHFAFPPGFIDPTDDARVAYPQYAEKVQLMKDRYKNQIEVLYGTEFDWLPEYEDWISEQMKRYPFDYVIGSVHFLGKIKDEKGERNFCIDYTKYEHLRGISYYGGVQGFVTAYFKEYRCMIQTGLFNGAGHLDLVKKYNDGSIFSETDTWYRKEVISTLDVLAQSSMVMEINTSGWERVCQVQYPSLWILKEARKRGIPVTLGSDAHIPEHVGRNITKAVQIAQQAGYTSLARFTKRQKEEVGL